MTVNINPNKICLLYYVPHHFNRKIMVRANSKIRILNNIHKDIVNTFIFKGNIINSESTFYEVGVSEGDIIIALKKSGNFINEEFIRWKKLSNDPNFINSLETLSNKKLKREQNRINDFYYMKIEGNVRKYKRQCRNTYLQKMEEGDIQIENNININYEPLLMPSTSALPIIW